MGQSKPKSVSNNISLKFGLDQRSYDKPNKSSMLPIMQTIAWFLYSNINTYEIKPNRDKILSVSIQSIDIVKTNNLLF